MSRDSMSVPEDKSSGQETLRVGSQQSDNGQQPWSQFATTPGWARFEYASMTDQWEVICTPLGFRKSPIELTAEDMVGKTFTCLDDAASFYEMYSALTGFGIRKSFLRYNVRGQPSNRTWVCCKEGERAQKHLELTNRIRTPRALTREKCMAMLQVTLCRGSGKWKVKSFVVEHSHPLAPRPFTQWLRDKRVVCEGAKTIIRNLQQSGVQTSKIMSYFAQSVGGYNNVRFTTKDVYNKLGREKIVTLLDRDAERAIGYLQGKADTDGDFYGRYTHDNDKRLRNVFWSDGKARADYGQYGDVLSFDSTYKTNQYGKPLLVFVGVNNHYRSTIFGYALLSDESNDTYVWALSTFMHCMRGCAPKSVITDGDLAMRYAITSVMPNSVHRLCAWHIEKNVVSNVKEAGFLGVMGQFIRRRFDADEFTRRWAAAIEEFGLHDNEYLKSMYAKRELWAETYLRSHFFAGQSTTQRSEKMNAFLKSKVCKKMNLCEFFRAIDIANSWLRHKQVEDEYKQFWTKPVSTMSNMSAVEEEAASVYTPAVFHKVQVELKREGKYMVQSIENSEGRIRAVLAKYPRCDKLRSVVYDPADDTYSCECGYMSSKGIPCRHIFSTMKALQKRTLPRTLINDRWRRNGFSEEWKMFDVHAGQMTKFLESDIRFGHVTSKCSEVAALASQSSETYDLAMTAINNLVPTLRAMQGDVSKCKDEDAKCSRKPHRVHNPTYGTTKGGWTGSKTGGKGKKRCSRCHRSGHNKATCKLKVRTMSSDNSCQDCTTAVEDDNTSSGADIDRDIMEEYSDESACSERDPPSTERDDRVGSASPSVTHVWWK